MSVCTPHPGPLPQGERGNCRGEGALRRRGELQSGGTPRYMLRRYCPPTSNSACVICPSEHTRTASISTSNTFLLSITACCRRLSIGPLAALLRSWKSFRRLSWLCFSSSVERISSSVSGTVSPFGLRKVFTPMIEDLYYRLSTVPIRVPALRDRKEDIPLLFRKFTSDFAERYKTQSVQLDANAQQMLMNYPWPGNVRELKNIAEQISVLSTDKMLTADALQRFLPQNTGNRGLALVQPAGVPIPSPNAASSSSDFNSTERDILYKLFFELKKDMTEIKQMLFNMGHQGTGFSPVTMPDAATSIVPAYDVSSPIEPIVTPVNAPIVLHPSSNGTGTVDHHEDVEESLMLADREKEFIIKSLKKHKGRRRDAANELGISERTLYRKIKEYDIKD